MAETLPTLPRVPGRQFVKLCDAPDFDDPQLRAMIEQMIPGRPPEEQVHRKYWEWAMVGLFLEDAGVLGEHAEALAVAAGQEPPLFWLANRIGRMVATDIYGEGSFSDREASASMLTDPVALAPFPYRQDHLEVRHMDALHLDYPDASFDIVFCLSSIEHFGGPEAARSAMLQMGRVVRPGGHLVVTTECLVGHHPLDSPKVQLAIRVATLGRRCGNATLTNRVIDAFTPEELDRWVVRPLAEAGLALVQPLDLSFSERSRENVTRWGAGNELIPATGSFHPHILLQAAGSPWTSVFLAFARPA
jgi:SAM-dependent methyltransferase